MPTLPAGDGVRLNVHDHGQGPPIVFVHGWMMSGLFFRRQWEALAPSHRCVAVDLRGCGDSDTKSGTHTMAQFGHDVTRLLHQMDLRGVTLVGWSMGGGVTMRCLEEDAEHRIARIVLVDFPPQFTEDPGVADKVCQRLREDRYRYLDGFYRRMFLHPPKPTDLAWMVRENDKCATDTACEMYRQLGVGSSRGKRFEVPALLVFPAQGWFPASLDEWREILPQHEAPPFADSRHAPFLEEADRLNEALRAFVGP